MNMAIADKDGFWELLARHNELWIQCVAEEITMEDVESAMEEDIMEFAERHGYEPGEVGDVLRDHPRSRSAYYEPVSIKHPKEEPVRFPM